ncbi:accessory gene regulator ArgB-like protein [Anaerosacchariphilus polymeriproducens]|uniref:Accessory regulator AgrB n=1 Tax=Anaerosacchariphilus polymeriproducens TaxID=1812858 RepID=A0A371AYJ6_9FIRM|nr:accessory gene regulator B family protein [Anaerosacchariphilus polymeriproducens]RDU24636.1 hypothetical protein DWV06_03995 [Anaerosacchariphilus polymeriproducens]
MDKFEHMLALKLTKWMNRFYPREECEQVVIAYGIEVFIDNIFKLIVYMFIAIYLGIVKESILMLLLFAILRKLAGGMHFDKNIVCFLVTGIFIVGGAYLSKIISINYIISSIVLLISGLILLKYAPSGTKKNPVVPEKMKPLKIKTVITFVVYVITAIILKDKILYNMVMIVSVVVSIAVLPVVNRKYKE